MTAPQHTTHPQRFVDPAALICPGCGEQVRTGPPVYWQVADGLPVAQFSHPDRTALCRRADGTVGDPVETQTPDLNADLSAAVGAPAYGCEECGTTAQWACTCWEAEAARYHHARSVGELVEAR